MYEIYDVYGNAEKEFLAIPGIFEYFMGQQNAFEVELFTAHSRWYVYAYRMNHS